MILRAHESGVAIRFLPLLQYASGIAMDAGICDANKLHANINLTPALTPRNLIGKLPAPEFRII
jgi:hypothetical protein